MRVARVAGLLIALSCGPLAGNAPSSEFAAARSKASVPQDGPVRLFDGTLSNFYTWLQDTKTDDPRRVFRVTDGYLHVTGDGLGCLTTKQEFRDYHCVLEYKWGPRVWRDRTEKTRDSGLLVHSLGADGAYDGIWMQSIEVQIIEGGVGDFIMVTPQKSAVEPLPFSLTATVGRDRDGEVVWQKDGPRETFTLKNRKRINWYGRDPDWADKLGFRGKNDVDSPGEQWTRIDTYCDGGRIEVFVNGVKVNEGIDVFPDFGRLQLQTELAEVFVRRWELWPLGKGPKPEPAVQTALFDGLGSFGRKVTTASLEAQRYFDQGLCFLYAFNHDEAIRLFRQAAEADPSCAMAWWGIALANGPHINNPIVSLERSKAAWAALVKAKQYAAGGTNIERALIGALEKRYADPAPDDRLALDQEYAAAMRDVWQVFPEDADLGALFAESLMDLRPWDLWTAEGQPQPGTNDIVAVLETVLARTPNHPLALHLYIHAVEASLEPGKAAAAADRLRSLQPGLGHLVHMPSHIDVRRGQWRQAIDANEKAVEADKKYRQQSPRQGFYHVYMAHNRHMLAYAATMRGQSRLALAAINEMGAGIPAEFVAENAALVDGFTAMPLEMLVRFGRWDEVLAAPEPAEYLPIARCLWRCARGIALAAKKEPEKAAIEQAEFRKLKSGLSPEARFGNNTAEDLLNVAEHLLAGEILYRQGKADEGIAALREAVRREDVLRYSEPPDWIHPVRHALGATLLAAGRAADAETVYREDLKRLPENGWSLYGLARSLRLLNKIEEASAVETRFQNAWRDADIQIDSSCFCQTAK